MSWKGDSSNYFSNIQMSLSVSLIANSNPFEVLGKVQNTHQSWWTAPSKTWAPNSTQYSAPHSLPGGEICVTVDSQNAVTTPESTVLTHAFTSHLPAGQRCSQELYWQWHLDESLSYLQRTSVAQFSWPWLIHLFTHFPASCSSLPFLSSAYRNPFSEGSRDVSGS